MNTLFIKKIKSTSSKFISLVFKKTYVIGKIAITIIIINELKLLEIQNLNPNK